MEDKLRRLFSGQKRTKHQSSLDDQLGTSCRQFFTQRVEFRPASKPDTYLEHLKSRYKPLNRLSMETDSKMDTSEDSLASVCVSSGQKETQLLDGVPKPKKVLFPADRLEMQWRQAGSIGAGLYNMGNTCFLNSVLQCLLYTAPLYNYLMSDDHKRECRLQGFCPMCELQRHCYRAFNTANGVMRPVPIVQNLKVIAKHFRQGRQEDAHELLRYLVDGLQKSCLQQCPPKLDPHSKATTVIHQIFGGYHRSQVKCMSCHKTSDTFDPLLDISLDIKNCPTLIKALQRSIKADLLDGENKYACPFCKKMTRAQKKFTIHRLPKVLTIQLKRFDYNSTFGGKINKPVAYVEYLNMRRYMSQPQGPMEWYRLYGVLVHYGFSCHSGHYYCYVRNSNGIWYCMNDSEVSQVSFSTVLQQEAYLLFYVKDDEYRPPSEPANPTAEKTSAPKIQPDPNFLGTAVKRTPGLDKMGSTLGKHPQKPTGVVPPSPHATPTLGRRFSIPLRKASTAGLIKHKAASSTPSPPETTPPPLPPPKAETAPPVLHPAFKSPGFTPRAIIAPPKPKKLLHKTPVDAKQPATTIEANVRKAEPILTEPQSPPGRKEGRAMVEAPPSDSEFKEVQTLLDIAEMGVEDDLPPAVDPATGAASVRGSSPARQQTFIGPLLPPCMQSPPPPPLSVQPFALKSPTATTKSPRVALVPPRPHPSKPVARVLPSPQVAASTTKPNVETVNAKEEEETVSENPLEDRNDVKVKKEKMKKDNAKHQKSAGDDTRPEPDADAVSIPAVREQPSASEPHMNSRSHWMVTSSSAQSSAGEKHSRPVVSDGYDSAAHGWTVIPQDPVTSDDPSKDARHGSSSKKKKKHQKLKSYASDSDSDTESSSDTESESDSDDERKRKKKRRKKKKPRYSSSEDDFTERIKSKKSTEAGEPKRRHERHKRRHHSDTDSSSFERHKGHTSEEWLERNEDRKYDRSELKETEEREGGSRRHRYGPERAKQRRHRSSSSSDTEDDKPGSREAHHSSAKKSEHMFRKLSSKHFRSRHYRSPHRQHHQYHSADSSSEDERKRVKHHSDEPRRERVINKPRFWRERDHFRSRPYYHHHHHPRDHGGFHRSRHASDEQKWKERSYQSYGRYHHKLSPESWRRKRMSSHQDRSRTPEKHQEKRHRTEFVDSVQTPQTPVMEVQWDRGGHSHQKWDGSRKSETVEQLIGQMETSVKSWDGGQSMMDSGTTEGESRKRGRSQWDEELDRGKVKKVKQHSGEEHKSPHGNLFQDYQSRKNTQGQKWSHRDRHGGSYRPKHGSHHHHHSHRSHQ